MKEEENDLVTESDTMADDMYEDESDEMSLKFV